MNAPTTFRHTPEAPACAGVHPALRAAFVSAFRSMLAVGVALDHGGQTSAAGLGFGVTFV